MSCMFPHSEYRTQTQPIFVLFYSTLPIKLILLTHSMHFRTIWTLNLRFSCLLTRTWNCSGTLPPFWCIPETRFVTSIRNTLDMTEGRHSARAEANSRKPPHFQTPGLDFQRTRVAWATRNTWLHHQPHSTLLIVADSKLNDPSDRPNIFSGLYICISQ